MTEFFFYFLSAVAIASAILMVLNRNAMFSVLYLIVCFFSVAGLYIMLHAPFVAVVHIIVYAGAIMVLFLFVVMLLNLNSRLTIGRSNLARLAAVVSGGIVLLVMVSAMTQSAAPATAATLDISTGSVEVLGKTLFTEFLIPFELSSILFISAMVGVVILTRKEETHE